MRIRLLMMNLILSGLMNTLSAQQDYQKAEFTQGRESIPYRILLPQDFDASKSYPLVIFLHGEDAAGRDNKKQLSVGGSLFTNDFIRQRYPAIVVFPQCPKNDSWTGANIEKDAGTRSQVYHFEAASPPTDAIKTLVALEKSLESQYHIDSTRIYVMGYSTGGSGVYELVRQMPGVFAAGIPIAGGADSSIADQVRKTAFWIFHGKGDQLIPVENSAQMVTALQRYYSTAGMQYTVYPSAHECWKFALAEPELLQWLFAQRRKP